MFKLVSTRRVWGFASVIPLILAAVVGILALGGSSTPTVAQTDGDPERGLTEEEHREAREAFAQCLEGHGFTVVRPQNPNAGRIGSRLAISSPDSDGIPDAASVAEIEAIKSDCYTTWLAEADALYRATYVPPSDDEIEAAQDALRECMAAGGTGEPLVDRSVVVLSRNFSPQPEPGDAHTSHPHEGSEEHGAPPDPSSDTTLVYGQCAEAIEAETGYYPTID